MADLSPILPNLLEGFSQIGKSFAVDHSIWWLIAPIIAFWILIDIYLKKYKKEELGWNTALGNGLSLLWVSFICLKYLFDESFKNFSLPAILAVSLILIYGILVVLNSYSHKLSKKVSFAIGSPTSIYFLSLIAILWTYGKLPITVWTTADLAIAFVIIIFIEFIAKKLVRPAKKEEENLEKDLDFENLEKSFPPLDKI